MPVAPQNIRWVVRRQLRDLLRDATDAQVEIGWPGDEATPDAIWLGGMVGTKAGEFLGTPRRVYNDTWSQQLTIEAWGVDRDSADERSEQITNVVEDVLATNTDLDATVGLLDSGQEIEIAVTGALLVPAAGAFVVVELDIPFFARIQ